jgi:hypothetical protein
MQDSDWAEMVDVVFDIHGDTFVDLAEQLITSCQHNHSIMARARPHELCQVILKCLVFGGDINDDGDEWVTATDDEKWNY